MLASIENFVNMFFRHIFIPRNTFIKEQVITTSDSEEEEEEDFIPVVDYLSDYIINIYYNIYKMINSNTEIYFLATVTIGFTLIYLFSKPTKVVKKNVINI